jgi:hypothetical protein
MKTYLKKKPEPPLAIQIPDYHPPKTLTKEEMYATIKEYFENIIEQNSVPTMTGLARHLGTTRQAILSAKNSDDEFADLLNYAISTIIEHVEKLLLMGRPPVGLIFWLKNNAGWIDKITTESTQRTINDIIEDLEREGKIIDGTAYTTPHAPYTLTPPSPEDDITDTENLDDDPTSKDEPPDEINN